MSTILTWPNLAASMSAVAPLPFRASTSTSSSIARLLTISGYIPRLQAVIRGVLPDPSALFTSTLRSWSSRSTSTAWPLWAAMKRGVAPELSPRLTSVFSHTTRLSTMSTWREIVSTFCASYLQGDHGGQKRGFVVCPIQLGLMRIGQKWQSNWAILRNLKNKVNKT